MTTLRRTRPLVLVALLALALFGGSGCTGSWAQILSQVNWGQVLQAGGQLAGQALQGQGNGQAAQAVTAFTSNPQVQGMVTNLAGQYFGGAAAGDGAGAKAPAAKAQEPGRPSVIGGQGTTLENANV